MLSNEVRYSPACPTFATLWLAHISKTSSNRDKSSQMTTHASRCELPTETLRVFSAGWLCVGVWMGVLTSLDSFCSLYTYTCSLLSAAGAISLSASGPGRQGPTVWDCDSNCKPSVSLDRRERVVTIPGCDQAVEAAGLPKQVLRACVLVLAGPDELAAVGEWVADPTWYTGPWDCCCVGIALGACCACRGGLCIESRALVGAVVGITGPGADPTTPVCSDDVPPARHASAGTRHAAEAANTVDVMPSAPRQGSVLCKFCTQSMICQFVG